MNALTLTLIRLAFLAVLWLFVIAAVGVVRTDLFGTSSPLRSQGRKAKQRARPPPQPSRPPKLARSGRAAPQQLMVTAGGLAGTSVGRADQQITIGGPHQVYVDRAKSEGKRKLDEVHAGPHLAAALTGGSFRRQARC